MSPSDPRREEVGVSTSSSTASISAVVGRRSASMTSLPSEPMPTGSLEVDVHGPTRA